jgi:gamma-glutamyltranspeptidase/glutathione hydrolase
MVATAHGCATDAGVEMLEEGGNAVDAAVAAALALGVCEPQASGLGGQTMMLLHHGESRRTFALDGSSRSPIRATLETIPKKKERYRGYRATTVPSSPAVWAYAAKTYGRLPWKRLMQPAIRLAEQGVRVSALQHWLQARALEQDHWKDGNAAAAFLDEGVRPYAVGSLFRQPVLAETLRRLADQGVEDFYQGDIARRIEADMLNNDGLMRRDDLAQIPWPIERRPMSGRYEGLRLLTFPEPGAGRNLLAMLNVIGQFPERRRDPDTPRGALLLAEVIRRAQIDRRDRPYDPAFYQQVEDRRMTSPDYAKLVAREIRKRLEPRGSTRKRAAAPRSSPGASSPGATDRTVEVVPLPEETRGDTTHLSVMDADGNVVGLTQSIERVYGAFVVTPDLGFLYNDYMSAFEFEDFSHPYYLRPNAVPWASVAPTILMRGRKPWCVVGSPGSERITTAIMQVLVRMLRHQSPFEAVAAPRMHCSVAGKISLEASLMRDDIPPMLEGRGFTVDRREPYSFFMGCVQLVLREGKTYIGVADPRRDGTARGPTP